MSERQTFPGLQHLNTSNSFMLCLDLAQVSSNVSWSERVSEERAHRC